MPWTELVHDTRPLLCGATNKSTRMMSILNLTPDSFSDGGVHGEVTEADLVEKLIHHFSHKDPNLILDIGGQSTRPSASEVSPEEELDRILPIIRAIRSNSRLDKLPISVDTYRATVAEKAIKAGANIVNDVSAGQLDPEMLPTIAKLGCTCILMHMRGNPETMSQLSRYPEGVIEGVGQELKERVREAEEAGIKRWRIILDPGIGFAKNSNQNLEILRRFSELRNFKGLHNLPWVVGSSRKKFIGQFTGVDKARDRIWGSAACVVAAIKGGADIVRVHDVEEMRQVAAMADAIYRVKSDPKKT